MSIIVLLSPIHFFPFFLLLELSFINLKPLYSHDKRRREIALPPFSKKNKKKKLPSVSTNNFKVDIKQITSQLEMSKNVISA